MFHLVERIRADPKYFPVSVDEIDRELRASGHFDCFGDYECPDEDGTIVSTRLRLNVTASVKHIVAWKIAIKMHETRIDGIDHEEWITREDGTRGPGGWHRHAWDPRARNADRRKVLLPGFDKGVWSVKMFLVKSFRELRIEVNKHDDGLQQLQFD